MCALLLPSRACLDFTAAGSGSSIIGSNESGIGGAGKGRDPAHAIGRISVPNARGILTTAKKKRLCHHLKCKVGSSNSSSSSELSVTWQRKYPAKRSRKK